ncbi:MAG: flagellar protein FlgN [Gammaproteobacteria bacterium]|jgi:flagellar biosynthesis/type III secretory pathway chaperone
MNNPSLIAESMMEVFQQQFKATKLLLKTLKQEYRCLSTNDITALEGIIANKQQCASELEQYEKRLFNLLTDANYESNNQGLKAFLQDIQAKADFSTLHNAWNVLFKTILECNEQNVINARIINSASVNIKQALNLLNGRSADNELYEKTGKTTDGGNSQTFTTA